MSGRAETRSVCSIIGKCELRVCVMILKYLSLYDDRMNVELFDVTLRTRKTLRTQ